jgi:hypothetical protein
MERHVPEFQAWNGCGDSKERTAARRHGGQIFESLRKSSYSGLKETGIPNINRADPVEAGKCESRIGGVESKKDL